jgi:outer membrane receptor protein involved in Fe transport
MMTSMQITVSAVTLLLCCVAGMDAATIRGVITDGSTLRPIPGATVMIRNTTRGSSANSRGEFQFENVPVGNYELEIRSIGYVTTVDRVVVQHDDQVITVAAVLVPRPVNSSEIVVQARADRETDVAARATERTAPSIVTVMSAQSIGRYPDASTAEIAKRIPGISITRVRGEARDAIVRGMEARYNNTLIDGMKIPSPSTNSRVVQLDYLASDLLQRVEVTKSLTPDMEADAIGGSVNLVMRTAPDSFVLRARVGTGYNSTLLANDLISFRTDSVLADPLEMHGTGYQSKPDDFTRDYLKLTRGQALPDFIGEFTLGKRYLDQRFGLILCGSLQQTSHYSETTRNYDAVDVNNNLYLVRRQYRLHGHRKTKWGASAKVDYIIDAKNDIGLSFTGFLRQNKEARLLNDTNLVYSPVLYLGSRTVFQTHLLANLAISGHDQLGPFDLKWRGGLAIAGQTKPDRAEFTNSQALVGDSVASSPVFYALLRDWQHNDDRELFGGFDMAWTGLSRLGTTFTFGALFRTKDRSNYQNEYRLVPLPDSLRRIPYFTSIDDQQWEVENTGGTPQYANNNYTCRENTSAAYVMGMWSWGEWNVLAGVRTELTVAHYATYDVNESAQISADKNYADVLPSLHIRYALDDKTNLRLSVGESISRPNYFDLVPYNYIGEEFREMGNPWLKRTRSINVDLKYETFPGDYQQFSAGAFYKLISDPIEYVLDLNDPALPTIIPKNLGRAANVGIELVAGTTLLDYFTIEANYTYTHSAITSDKILFDKNAGKILTIRETRPLQGESEHIGNLALAFNRTDWGTFGQLSFAFTGRRVAQVSIYKGYDHYESDFPLLDLSAEQRIARNLSLSLFLRLNNLLNTMYEVHVLNGQVIEEEQFGRTFTIGFNYQY